MSSDNSLRVLTLQFEKMQCPVGSLFACTADSALVRRGVHYSRIRTQVVANFSRNEVTIDHQREPRVSLASQPHWQTARSQLETAGAASTPWLEPRIQAWTRNTETRKKRCVSPAFDLARGGNASPASHGEKQFRFIVQYRIDEHRNYPRIAQKSLQVGDVLLFHSPQDRGRGQIDEHVEESTDN